MTMYEKLYLNGYRTKKICSYIAAKYFLADISLAYHGDGNTKVSGNEYWPVLNIAIQMADWGEPVEETIERCGNEWDDNEYTPFKNREYSYSNRRKTFTFSYPSYEGCWSSREKDSRLMLDIDWNGKVNFIKLSGVDPRDDQMAAMVAAATLRTGGYDRNRRKYPFTVACEGEYSTNLFLKLYQKVGNKYHLKESTKKLHVSGCSKISNIPSIWKGDLWEVFRTTLGYETPRSKKDSNLHLKKKGIKFDKPTHRNDLMVDHVDFDPHPTED